MILLFCLSLFVLSERVLCLTLLFRFGSLCTNQFPIILLMKRERVREKEVLYFCVLASVYV